MSPQLQALCMACQAHVPMNKCMAHEEIPAACSKKTKHEAHVDAHEALVVNTKNLSCEDTHVDHVVMTEPKAQISQRAGLLF